MEFESEQSSRTLLLFSPDSTKHRAVLIGDEWRVLCANTLSQAKASIAKHRPQIGLILWDQELELFESLLEEEHHGEHGMQWVGLFSREQLNCPRYLRLISSCLHYAHALPCDPARLHDSLMRALRMAQLRKEVSQGGGACGQRFGMVGSSPAMLQLYRLLEKVAAVQAPVLITGESGTGKELAARAIHKHSARANGPFIEVNCGALPANLIQSELFGYERGAFTGANQRKVGKVEAAHGGLLFLDEIGDLPLELQSNLLRFLQEWRVQRVGGTASVPVDTRIVAATHRNLEQAVREGKFREDLYYRLNVLRLRTPALRERSEDIVDLAQHFLMVFRHESAARIKGFSSGALNAMRMHHWPGNVRELMNRVRSAAVMSESGRITAYDLGLGARPERKLQFTLEQARDEAERRALELALIVAKGNVSQAANIMKVSRRTLYRMLEKHMPPERK